ncbi:hypothetical protein EA473_17060 [Natrarchaeobius chitinivorans]|uniref:Uncharacterized protein n=1 Tax=Natrarchaeobius chitinivorans TaxID=1679083 RepID=A0A3N6N2H8_NATCH|nr:hypothetical protein EA473_17060 [Natrarchaeobius chitinivorans]
MRLFDRPMVQRGFCSMRLFDRFKRGRRASSPVKRACECNAGNDTRGRNTFVRFGHNEYENAE